MSDNEYDNSPEMKIDDNQTVQNKQYKRISGLTSAHEHINYTMSDQNIVLHSLQTKQTLEMDKTYHKSVLDTVGTCPESIKVDVKKRNTQRPNTGGCSNIFQKYQAQ